MGVIGSASGLRATFEARRAGWAAQPTPLVWQPTPPSSGDAASARRLAEGVLLFDGACRQIEAGSSPWKVEPPSDAWRDLLHGHGWLDDFAATNHAPSRQVLIAWVHDWIAAFGQGAGPGWAPELVARRLTRLIAHSLVLLRGVTQDVSHAYFRTLNAHARFLDRRWKHTSPGLPRVEALAGLLYARLSLESGMQADMAIRLLGEAAHDMADPSGALTSRNAEDLMQLQTLLSWTAETLTAAEMQPSAQHLATLDRLTSLAMGISHADGALPRFHGSRTTTRLPRTPQRSTENAMGYLRLAAGATSVVMDATPAPRAGAPSKSEPAAFASALAIELTSGEHPVIVSAGSGRGFGAEAEVSARSPAAHCGLILGPALDVSPDRAPVSASLTTTTEGHWVLGESSVWRDPAGLIHERRLHLAPNGLHLGGEDTIVASSAVDRAALSKLLPSGMSAQVGANFLIHPDATAALHLNGRAALITLADGAKWMLRGAGAPIELRPARFHDPARIRPRATKQIVVMGEIAEYWGRITWSLEQLSGPPGPGGV